MYLKDKVAVLKEKKSNPRILYTFELSIKCEEKVNML